MMIITSYNKSIFLILLILSIIIINVNCIKINNDFNFIDKKDTCFDYIPKSIIDINNLIILKPDRGGLKDLIIKSTPKYEQHQQQEQTQQQQNNTSLYFLLKDLKPNTQYALRISYIASSPADYIIKFFDNPLITTETLNQFKQLNNNNNNNNNNKPTRDLLNTEIIKFKTDDSSYVMETFDNNFKIKHNPCSIIKINSINLGVTPKFVKNDGYKYQTFDLIMDTESIGVPPEIPKLVLIVVSSLIVVFIIVKKYLYKNISSLLNK